jgi:hypothetical protein
VISRAQDLWLPAGCGCHSAARAERGNRDGRLIDDVPAGGMDDPVVVVQSLAFLACECADRASVRAYLPVASRYCAMIPAGSRRACPHLTAGTGRDAGFRSHRRRYRALGLQHGHCTWRLPARTARSSPSCSRPATLGPSTWAVGHSAESMITSVACRSSAARR